jgi:hypothetical protein
VAAKTEEPPTADNAPKCRNKACSVAWLPHDGLSLCVLITDGSPRSIMTSAGGGHLLTNGRYCSFLCQFCRKHLFFNFVFLFF